MESEGQSFREKRVFERFPIRKEVRISGPKGVAIGELRDMSIGGAGLFLKYQVASEGDLVELELPHAKEGEMTLSGKIVWIAKAGDGIRCGLKFFRMANAVIHENMKRLREQEQLKAGPERRQNPRIAHRVLVKYGSPSELYGMLENVSLGGFSVTLDSQTQINRDVTIEIPHPVTKKLLILTGKAIHQMPLEALGKTVYRVGFRFDFLTAEQRSELAEFLKDLTVLASNLVSKGYE
jgi:hypothetical protein